MRIRIIIVAALIIFVVASGASVTCFADNYAIENEFIKRSIVTDHGVRTDEIIDVKKGKKVPVVSAGFRIVLQDGREYRSNDFEIVSVGGSATERHYELRNAESGITAALKFTAAPGEPWVRKTLELHSQNRNISVVEIERFRFSEDEKGTKSPYTGGGKTPLYFENRLFIAGEGDGFDVTYSDGVVIVSYAGNWEKSLSITSVIGVADGEAPLSKTYEKYVASRSGRTAERKIITAISLPTDYEKFEPYDRRKYFEDMMKIFGAPQNGPSALVLSGFDDVSTSAMAKKYLNADAAMVINARIDGVGVACAETFNSRASHMDGVLDRTGKAHPQLIVIRGLADCRAPQDEKKLSDNISKYVQEIRNIVPSTLLAGDYSSATLNVFDFVVYGKNIENKLMPPSSRSRMGELTKRDAVVFEAVASDARLKKTGFFAVTGELSGNPVAGESASEAMAQEVVLKLFTGGPAGYLKLDFTKMTDAGAATVAALVNWAAKNSDILNGPLSLIGPSPLDGKPYGYSRFSADGKGLIILRNPSFLSSQFELNVDGAAGFITGKDYGIRIAYPYEAILSKSAKYGAKLNIPIEREQMLILEVAEAGQGAFENSNIPMTPSPGIAMARELKKSETASGVEGVYIFNVPDGIKAQAIMYVETADASTQKSIKGAFVVNGDSVEVARSESFGIADGEEAPSGWVMFGVPLKNGENRVGFNVVCPGAKLWSWLITENAPAAGSPLFKSGLPARWNSVTKSDIRLF